MRLRERIGKWLLGPEPEKPAPQKPLVIPGLSATLRSYQEEGVRYLATKRKVLLADEMGLGKTLQTLAAVEHVGAYPAVVVCPSSLKLNWADEAQRWLPHRKVQVLRGNKVGPIGGDIIVLNYEIAYSWHRHLLGAKPKAIIMDEAHYIKNPDAIRSGCLAQIAREIDMRLLLTGTPILNRPEELVALLSILDQIKALGGYWYFSTRYCRGGSFKHAYKPNLTELNKELRERCYLRREKSNVLKELPAKTRTVVPIELGCRSEYEHRVKMLLKNLGKPGALPLMAGLEQLRCLVGLGKVLAVQNWVDTFLSTGSKLILFAEHREVQQRFMSLWPTAAHVVADDSEDVRHAQVKRFQTDPECQLIICSLRAAGVGLTLTAASDVAFAELGWTPAQHDQAEDRAHRFGQVNAVNCWYLNAKNTLDDYTFGLIEAKRAMVSAATSGKYQLEDGEVAQELVSLLKAHCA